MRGDVFKWNRLIKKIIGILTILCLCSLIIVFFVTKKDYKPNNKTRLEEEIFHLYHILDREFEEFTISINLKADSEEEALKMAKDFAEMVNGVVEPMRKLDENVIANSIGLDYEEGQNYENIIARFWYDVK